MQSTRSAPDAHPSPTLSVGIPVRNEAAVIARTVGSVLAQDGVDVEVVISDNASTDATPEICRELQASDPRVRFYASSENLGQQANFSRAFELSSGTFFRWLGASDVLEPGYAKACLTIFEEDPDCVVVTTRYELLLTDGSLLEAGWAPGPDSANPLARLREMLRLLNAGYREIDPVYSMIRREGLERTGVIRRHRYADQLLATELALLGPFGHVPESLAKREHPRFLRAGAASKRWGVPLGKSVFASEVLCRAILEVVQTSDLAPAQRRAARSLVARFYIERHAKNAQRRIRRVRALLVPASGSVAQG
jgi:glycosyltransferase involved in cell wall biosynthesis